MRRHAASDLLAAVGAAWFLLMAGQGFAQQRIEVAPAGIPPALAAPATAATLAAPVSPLRRIDLGIPDPAERARLAALNAAPATSHLPSGADPAKSRPLAIGFPRALPGVVHGSYLSSVVVAAEGRHGAFWSPVIEGEAAIVEIVVAANAELGERALRIDRVSHLVADPSALASGATKRIQDIDSAGACNVDVVCELPDPALEQAARSVGKLVFSGATGGAFLCSGTLIDDAIASYTPYVHTATHCIESAFEASTINVCWLFRAPACRSLAALAAALVVLAASTSRRRARPAAAHARGVAVRRRRRGRPIPFPGPACRLNLRIAR